MKNLIRTLLLFTIVFTIVQTYRLRDPVWPTEFMWSMGNGRPGYACTKTIEPADKHTWQDNVFCQKMGNGIKNIGMKWSHNGK